MELSPGQKSVPMTLNLAFILLWLFLARMEQKLTKFFWTQDVSEVAWFLLCYLLIPIAPHSPLTDCQSPGVRSASKTVKSMQGSKFQRFLHFTRWGTQVQRLSNLPKITKEATNTIQCLKHKDILPFSYPSYNIELWCFSPDSEREVPKNYTEHREPWQQSCPSSRDANKEQKE